MYKDCNVVLLNSQNSLRSKGIYKDRHYGSLEFSDYNTGLPQHPYITSDEKIVAGDWFINTKSNKIHQAQIFENTVGYFSEDKVAFLFIQDYFKKVIASTDPKLIINIGGDTLPLLPQSFLDQYITEYNKGNVIQKIQVEYQQEWTTEIDFDLIDSTFELMKPKTNPDNTINIKALKDSWTREEVIDHLYKMMDLTPEGQLKYIKSF